jgi:DNA-binding NarL/FixJ family response regulator
MSWAVSVQDCCMSEQAGGTRVLIVDDDPFTRTVLRSVVDVPPFIVVGVCGTFAEGLSVARQEQPAVLLVDLDLGEGPTGIDLAHAIRRFLPDVGIVMLSTYIDPRLIDTNVELPRGSIYLTKQEVEELGILHGALVSAARMPHGGGHTLAGDERLQNLTDGQVEVMRLIAAGFSNSEIARRLVIEEASVEKAVMRLIRQLDVKATREENQRVMIAQAYFALSGTRSVHRS